MKIIEDKDERTVKRILTYILITAFFLAFINPIKSIALTLIYFVASYLDNPEEKPS